MPAVLTEEEFSKHLDTTFRFRHGAETEVELKLEQVKTYASQHKEHEGMERFSVSFIGPEKPFMDQMTYAVAHEQMGEFELFLVPIVSFDGGFRYEAVFNYFKQA